MILQKYFAGSINICIFAWSSNNKSSMKSKSKERRKAESDLLYFLQLYNTLKGRKDAVHTRAWLDDQIELLVEKLKLM